VVSVVYTTLMIGSPGSGKTMLSRRLPSIMQPLTPAESLETTRIYSATGRLNPGEALVIGIQILALPHFW
jgi:magnesium chelatase family protein